MPLIRYDTGDLARISQKAKCSLLTPVFTKIEGRRVDFIYNTNNNLLSPHVITNTMWKFTEVVQFQFIQNTEKEYHFKLNCVLNKLADENLLISEIKKYVGNDAIISIEYVDEIPLLSSGKRKKIINNFRPNG
jgi:phenylacetate-CoA ligase